MFFKTETHQEYLARQQLFEAQEREKLETYRAKRREWEELPSIVRGMRITHDSLRRSRRRNAELRAGLEAEFELLLHADAAEA